MFLAASALVTGGFIVLPLLLAAAFLWALERAGKRMGHPAHERARRFLNAGAAVLAWLLLTAIVAASGILRSTALPPPFVLLAAAVAVIALVLPLSRWGTLLLRGLPSWVLVGYQVFRLPLELVMHRAYEEGVLPSQMTYSGRNFDIVTGITAGLLGAWLLLRPAPRWVIAAWNAIGLALLINVVSIAILSTPVFAAFGPERLNTLVTYPPFVWLPAILVVAALAGHVLVWRWLREQRARQGA